MNFNNLVINSEASRCMACIDAPCSVKCAKALKPDKALLSLRFKNIVGASRQINSKTCVDCDAPCESACIHFDKPVRIREVAMMLKADETSPVQKDLSIDFCGIKCENPYFLSSSIVASGYEMCAKALEMGWAGIVYKTIGFYTPEEVSPRFDSVNDENGRIISFKNLEQISDKSVAENMDILKRLKQNYPSKVIVASVMGQNDDEWTKLAKLSQEAGVDMIECNFSCPHMSADGLGSDVGQNPELVSQYMRATRRGTTLPILAKMTPNIGHMELVAEESVMSGATGLAAINTLKSITKVNHDSMVGEPNISGKSAVSGLSGRSVKPIALRFIHDMATCQKLSQIPISGMGGVENFHDALDFITLGCSNVQITTAVMEYGYRIIYDLKDGLSNYMHSHNIEKLEDLVGVALKNFCSADDLDRKTVIYPRFNRQTCVGCKRCVLSCQDAGHQALTVGVDNIVRLKPKQCVGCHLCKLVCPTGTIT